MDKFLFYGSVVWEVDRWSSVLLIVLAPATRRASAKGVRQFLIVIFLSSVCWYSVAYSILVAFFFFFFHINLLFCFSLVYTDSSRWNICFRMSKCIGCTEYWGAYDIRYECIVGEIIWFLWVPQTEGDVVKCSLQKVAWVGSIWFFLSMKLNFVFHFVPGRWYKIQPLRLLHCPQPFLVPLFISSFCSYKVCNWIKCLSPVFVYQSWLLCQGKRVSIPFPYVYELVNI